MPSYGEVAQIITAISAFGALMLSWHNSKKIAQVHKLTNSMKDELVREVRASEHAKGLKEGRAETP